MTELESVEYFQDQHISITAYCNQQQGGASSTDFSDAAIEHMIQKACHIARYTQPDPYAGLPDPKDLAMSPPAVEVDFPWDISIDHAIELIRNCVRHTVLNKIAVFITVEELTSARTASSGILLIVAVLIMRSAYSSPNALYVIGRTPRHNATRFWLYL